MLKRGRSPISPLATERALRQAGYQPEESADLLKELEAPSRRSAPLFKTRGRAGDEKHFSEYQQTEISLTAADVLLEKIMRINIKEHFSKHIQLMWKVLKRMERSLK